MNAFIDECIDAGLREEGGPNKAVSLNHHMDKAAEIKNLCIHMFYQSCDSVSWRIVLVITMSIKSCKFKADNPLFKDTVITTPSVMGAPTKTKLVELTVGLIKKLKAIKFDKLTGYFTNTLPYFVPELSSADDCCVCMEKTKTKTSCGHTLCCECWHNLREDVCPICRNDNLLYCTGDCDDDE